MPVVIDTECKVVVPKEVLDQLGAKPGDLLQANFERLDDVPYTHEPLGPEAQAALRKAKAYVAAGRVHGPFDTAAELIQYLKNHAPKCDI